MKAFAILLIAVPGMYACGPDPIPPQCNVDSIDHLNGEVYTGHITLCNAQGAGSLIYEPGTCLLEIKNGKACFQVTSTNNSFIYNYADTLEYSCIIRENRFREFELYNSQDTSYMGTIDDTRNNGIHLIIIDAVCFNSSFFEGKK